MEAKFQFGNKVFWIMLTDDVYKVDTEDGLNPQSFTSITDAVHHIAEQWTHRVGGGVVSSGTLNRRSLMPSFIEALDRQIEEVSLSLGREHSMDMQRRIGQAHRQIGAIEARIAAAEGGSEKDRMDYFRGEESGWDMVTLEELLAEFAPSFMHFSAHEGDGACFGYWASIEPLIEHVHDAMQLNGEVIEAFAK